MCVIVNILVQILRSFDPMLSDALMTEMIATGVKIVPHTQVGVGRGRLVGVGWLVG